MKKQILEMVKGLVGNEYLYFEDALTVKKTPHTSPVNIWAISVKGDKIFLMDRNEQWFELEESDINYSLVVASLWARLKVMSKKVA